LTDGGSGDGRLALLSVALRRLVPERKEVAAMIDSNVLSLLLVLLIIRAVTQG
jgi:hypothetical protein